MIEAASAVARVLVVDDEPDLCVLYQLTLEKEGYVVGAASSLHEAWRQLESSSFDVVITDMRLPDGHGLELLHRLRTDRRRERCIVITAYGSAENAVNSLKAGAFDYLTKPVELKQLRQVVSSATMGFDTGMGELTAVGEPWAAMTTPQAVSSAASTAPHPALGRLIGSSEAMAQVRERIRRVAKSMAPVLVMGESGTGKELAANALHGLSHRHSGPLIAVNCSAIPESLLEAEFFGSKKGAFTGAAQDRAGFFHAADGGTLFLDEIGDLPLSMQAKLLRAIQERRVRPVGSSQEEIVDVRIVSATHKDLAAEVLAGRFRQDLYYRLNVIEVRMPALRERMGDLRELCQALLERIAVQSGIPVPVLPDDALMQLANLPLRGNVRELENHLHRAVALNPGGKVAFDLGSPATLPLPLSPATFAGDVGAIVPVGDDAPIPSDLQAHLDGQERAILVRALKLTKFNRTAAAARLGLSLRQIRYRMARLAIDVPEDGDVAA
jgi:two-component system, NtrC family, response regulator PilR